MLAEHNNGQLSPATLNAITAASKLGEVTCLVAAEKAEPIVSALAKTQHVKKILVAENQAFRGLLAGEYQVLLGVRLRRCLGFSSLVDRILVIPMMHIWLEGAR